MNPILGPNSLHWASALLNTHYREFHSPFGIQGLAKESNGGKALHVLALHTPVERRCQGCFRSFIGEAKQQYEQIFVWEIANPIVESALIRYGFTPTTRVQQNETIMGMKWENSARAEIRRRKISGTKSKTENTNQMK